MIDRNRDNQIYESFGAENSTDRRRDSFHI